MEFNICDRVKIKEYSQIPEELRNNRLGMLAGNEGEIVDKLWSDSASKYLYMVQFDGKDRPSTKLFVEEMLEPYVAMEAEYTYEIRNLGNVMLAIMFEEVGETKTELARGHGHIFHEGVIGIAQATSWAMKKCYEKLSGGDVR